MSITASQHFTRVLTVAIACLSAQFLMQRASGFQPPPAGQDTPLHQAVRDDAIDRVNALLDGGADINALGSDNHTPLSLALQLGRLTIAELLLRRGAMIRFTSDTPSQPSDVSFVSSNDSLANAFAIRLLQQSILHFNQLTREAAQADLDRFNSNSSLHFDDIIWTINCDPCSDGPIQVGGNNQRVKFVPIRSERIDRQSADGQVETDFRLQQDLLRPWVTNLLDATMHNPASRADALNSTTKTTDSLSQSLPGPLIHYKLSELFGNVGPFTFTVSGKLTIPSCDFSFDISPTCDPAVSVDAFPTLVDDLQRNCLSVHDVTCADLGPAAGVSLTQNGTVLTLNPGASAVVDRSAGPITIQVGPATQQTFTVGVDLERLSGPDVSIQSGDLRPRARVATYAKVAALHQELDRTIAGAQPGAIYAKELNTSIHALSAKAIIENYHLHALDLLRPAD